MLLMLILVTTHVHWFWTVWTKYWNWGNKFLQNLNNWILWFLLEHMYYILCMYIFIQFSFGPHLYFVRTTPIYRPDHTYFVRECALGLLGSTTEIWHFWVGNLTIDFNLFEGLWNKDVPTVTFKRCSSLNKTKKDKTV